VRQLLAMVLLAALSTVVHAQVTCQTNGNTTNCNGSLGGSTISDSGTFNSNLAKISAAQYGPNAVALQQQAAAQAQLANQEARLVAQQAEYVRQQTLSLQRQQEAETANNRREPEPQNSQREAEPLDRSQEAEALSWYESYMTCLKRFPRAQTSDEAAAISGRCKQDTSATSTAPQDIASSAAAISTVKGQATGPQSSRFRQKWSALDDALANGVITKAEFDKKLSALLEHHRREPDDR
jgi:hypothetical protein